MSQTKRFRIIAVCLALLIALSSAAIADEPDAAETYSLAGYDGDTQYRSWTNNLFFQRMQALTGVALTLKQYTDYTQWQAFKNAMKPGSDNLPDGLFKAELTPDEARRMLDEGVIIDLNPLIDSYCPNLCAAFYAHPGWREAITMPDGRIATLPLLTESPMQNAVWVNTAWLSTLRLQMPSDRDGFRAVLEAFRDSDPNRNGKRDEIPLMFLGAFDLKFLAHAFGLIANDYNVYEADGRALYMPSQPEFREFVAWLRGLYADGLLDHDGFYSSDTLRTVTDEKAVNRCGMIITTMPSNVLPTSWMSQYAVMTPLEHNGARVYRDFMGGVVRGTFAVTSACSDPGGLLKWVDALYGEEGALLAYVGKENEDYVVDGDGTWRLTETAGSNSYFTAEALITGTAFPSLEPIAFQTRYSEAAVRDLYAQLASLNQYVKRPFPIYWLTEEEQKQATAMQNALGRYVDEQIARFVLGEIELTDESWQVFMDTLDEKGLPAFMAFWQNVLDSL